MIRRLTESQIVIAFIKPGRSRLLSGCFLGIGLALLSLWFSAHVWAQEPGDSPANLDVILLIDNSLSMSHADPVTGAPPSDPEGLRIQAAEFLVDYLRANAETLGADYRVGVVSFGGVVSDVIPLRPLQDGAVREGIQAEEIQFTDFGGPLQFALREFRAKSFGTGNRMAVVLFTDGRPNLTDAPVTEQEVLDCFGDLAPLVGELQDGGVSLFFLGIGDAQENSDNWARLIPREHYTPITSTAELAGVYHRVAAGLIGVAVSEGETIPAGRSAPIEVGLYLERVVFSFAKSDPSIHIVLTSPTGAVLRPTIGAADIPHSIYSVPNPDAGEWKAFWEGEGEVRYWVDRQYPLMRVEPIESASLVGQPITITASLVRNDEPVVDPSLHLEAEITLPGGDVVTQPLSPVGGGRHTGIYEDVKAEGTYMVTAKAILDGHLLSVRPVPLVVEVFPRPILPTPIPQPTHAPAVVTPVPTATPTSTTGLAELLGSIGPILLIIVVVGLGIALWLLYRNRKGIRERNWPEILDELRKATSRRQIERIMRPIERDARAAQELEEYAPSAFAIKILKLYAIKEDYAERELKRYAGSGIGVEKRGAGIAIFNLLIREEPHAIFPRLRAFMGLGCDNKILQYAEAASVIRDVPELKEVDRRQAFDVSDLCRIYSGLCDRDEPRLPTLQMDVKKLFKRYGAEGSFALLECICDSRRLRKGLDVIPIRVSPQLRESSFVCIPQLRPLGDILLQFEGTKLYPLHTEDEDGFLNILEKAQRRLSQLEEGAILPEWYIVSRLFESWRDFIERELSEKKAKANLVMKPVTRWFPKNVRLGDVHVAWVIHNEGPSFAKIDQIVLYRDGQELECDTKGEMLLRGDQKRVVFRLSELEGSEPPADLDLVLAVSLSDMWEHRTERFSRPHRGFEVMKAFRGPDVLGGRGIVELLHSNKPLIPDELVQYCLEAELYVHCNQLALLQLLEYSGGYPLFVHILLHGLIRYLKDDERWKTDQPRYVTCTDVPQVVEHVVGRDLTNFPGLIAEAWDTFPSDERTAIEALLESTQRHRGEPPDLIEIQTFFERGEPVAPILERLETKGMLEKRDGRYRLRANLLEQWLQARQERDRAPK
jgi:hypothetical protein